MACSLSMIQIAYMAMIAETLGVYSPSASGGYSADTIWKIEKKNWSKLVTHLISLTKLRKGRKKGIGSEALVVEHGTFFSIIFLIFCRTWTKRYLITSQTRVKRVSRIHHRIILWSDSQKRILFGLAARNRLSLSLPLSFSSSSYFLSFSKRKFLLLFKTARLSVNQHTGTFGDL